MPRPKLTRHEQLSLAVAADCDPRTVVRWLDGLPLLGPTQRRLDAAALKLGYSHQTALGSLALTSVKPPKA